MSLPYFSVSFFTLQIYLVSALLVNVHHNQQQQQSQQLLLQRQQLLQGNQLLGNNVHLWERFWREYSTGWINIGIPHPNDTNHLHSPNGPLAKYRFFSLLNRRYRSGHQNCVDKHGSDCEEWANQGYCTHIKSRYRSWMGENCPRSCGLCKAQPGESNCVNLKDTCALLFRYCTGPFSNYMRSWCPRTCKFCSDSSSSSTPQGQVLRDENESSSTGNIPGSRSSGSDTCFPTNCGTVPIYNRRHGRGKREVLRSNNGYTSTAATLKIVGGSRAVKGEWPWHGLLVQQLNEQARFCGVTIICRHWVATAAHCVASQDYGFTLTKEIMKTFIMYVGRHQGLFGYSERSTQAFTASDFERFVVHQMYRLTPSFSYDIALIKLKRSSAINFNRYVQPVCMPTTNDLNSRNILTTYGWGSTMNQGPSAEVLKEIRLPFVNKATCSRRVWGLHQMGIFCAGGKRNQDTCVGDSGGSLVMRKATNDSFSGRFFFYGITSYGTYHCNTKPPYKPSVYTDVAHYYEWIRKQTNGCCEDSPPAPEETENPAFPKNVSNNRPQPNYQNKGDVRSRTDSQS